MSNTIKYSKTNFKELFGKGSDVQVAKNVDADLTNMPWKLVGSEGFTTVYTCERNELYKDIGEMYIVYIKLDLGATPIILRVTP
jgi:hypothetical protein